MRIRVTAVLLTVGCLSLAMPEAAVGAATKFPSSNPAFSFELSSGWSSAFDKKGTFSSQPRGDETYNFSILDLTGIGNSKELRAAMPELAKATGLKNFKLGQIGETGSETMEFLEVKGHGDSDGVPLTVVVTGFEAQKGRFFALLAVGTGESIKKYGRDYEALAGSIEPLQAMSAKESRSDELPIADTTLGWSSKTGYVSVYFQPNGKCSVNFQGNEARYPKGDGNSTMTKSYDVTQLSGGTWRVRIHLDEPDDITFRVTKTNPSATNGQTVIAAVGKNDADPYQHGEEGELNFVRGKQSRPPL